MKTFALLLAAALLQAGATDAGPRAQPQFLHWQRAITVSAGTNGPACAILDATTFAHASSRDAEDLRIFNNTGAEIPFAFTENSPSSANAESATVENLGTEDGRIVFDLRMPSRAYSDVDIDLDTKNFVAVANVQAQSTNGTVRLGSVTLFDLSAQHMGRSTSLPLQETTFPLLHVSLRFADSAGTPLHLSPSVVRGATVPPSREAQTLYTVVAVAPSVRQRGRNTIAEIDVPAHVPIERVAVKLDPAYKGNFIRAVSIDAKPEGNATQDGEDRDEQAGGEISQVNLHPQGLTSAPPIHVERLAVDAVLAVNAAASAHIAVTIANGDDPPLPIRAVELKMRQREICFDAAAGSAYTLRYGDPALQAPQYDFQRLFDPGLPHAQAALGPESPNPRWIARKDTRPFSERHPDLIWFALFGVMAVLGATALASVRQQRAGH